MLAVPTHEEDKSIPFNDPNSLRQCSVDLRHLLGLGWSAGVLWDTRLESVLELAGNSLEVTAASGTGGLAALGLLGPVVCCVLVCARCVAIRFAIVSEEFGVYVHPRTLAAGYPQEEQVCF